MNEFVFTAAGQQLVSRMIAGEATATFTRVETSDHEYTKSEVEMLTALVDVKQEVLISKVTRIDPAKVELLIALDNRELRETYIVKAIGVYASDSDQQEILFGIAVNTDTPDPMPVLAGKTISELTYHLVIAVAVSDQIEISVNPSAGATVEQLEELETAIATLFPDLPVPTIDDVGKVLKIGAGGKAVWAIDSSAQWQSMFPDFAFSTTTDFSGDGNKHVEVTYSNGYKTVSDVLDSKTVKEMLYDPAGQLLATKMVTIAEDGKSVAETVTAE